MPDLDVVPVDAGRWDDLAALFRSSGDSAGCWCMWHRLPGREWETAGSAGRRAAMAELVSSGAEPGLLAYDGETPAGWVAVAPRTGYARMTSPRARVYRPLDDAPTWVVSCFVIARSHRRSGVAASLLDAAVTFAADHGASVVEGYPIDTSGPASDSALYTGTLAMFTRAGFVEVQRSYGRPLVRRTLE